MIREKLDRGALPRDAPGGKLLAGFGRGNVCDGCDTPVLPAQVEYEIETATGRVRLHLACAGLWAAERRRRGWSDPSERGILDRLQHLARAWPKVTVYPNRAGGTCDVCGQETPRGEEQFLVVQAAGEGERTSLDPSCYMKWMVERNKRFSAAPPPGA